MVGRVENLAMHLNMLPLVFTQMNPPGGIKGVFALNRVPFVFAQSLVIFGVHDGVFALSERYAAKGVAVADAAVEQYQSHERPYEGIGNRYGKIELDNHYLED